MDRACPLNPNPFVFHLTQLSQFSRSLGLAALVTLLLVFVMSRLIATEYEQPQADPYPRIQPIHMPKAVPTVQKAEPPARPETPPVQSVTTPVERTVDTISLPTAMSPPRPDQTGLDPTITSRDPVPVFKPAPRYPSAALRRGIEGYVVVEFTIGRTGSVIEPRVVAGYDGEGNLTTIFDRAAIAAVVRFKYQPQLDDGVPVVRHGVRNRISFKLAD